MDNQRFTRRQFLQQTGIAGGALLLESAIFGHRLGAAFAPTQPTVLIRKDIDALTGPEIAAFRTGVSVMQSRPVSSPTSWEFQANMHGFPGGGGSNPAWGRCQHGSFFFLAWHRMYLHFFERILRAASGSPNLTLPYWNYSKNTPTARALPQPFRGQTIGNPPTANPLFVAQRNPGLNTGALLPASAVQTGSAMGMTNFINFGGRRGGGGRLEFQPHNAIHSQISGWMGSASRAARDPIFWLHHANIDRLWTNG
jgi:tyrosinase